MTSDYAFSLVAQFATSRNQTITLQPNVSNIIGRYDFSIENDVRVSRHQLEITCNASQLGSLTVSNVGKRTVRFVSGNKDATDTNGNVGHILAPDHSAELKHG